MLQKLGEKDCLKIKDIKERVRFMVGERGKLSGDPPSSYWSFYANKFEYMLGLSEEYYSQIRDHTYHINGDYYFFYLHPPFIKETAFEWNKVIEGIPEKYILSEPENASEVGCRIGNRIVNNVIIKLQRAVNAMLREGIMERLEKSKRPRILEIGAGYGTFVYQLSRLLNNASFVVVDLPETLLFSAAYLSIFAPEKSFYLYGEDFYSTGKPNLDRYDFVLMPNYKLDELKSMKFDFAANISSFQEMKRDQVERYMDFLSKTLEGELYSFNGDATGKNPENVNVTNSLKKIFRLKETSTEPQHSIWDRLLDLSPRKFLNKIHRTINPKEYHYWAAHEYVCRNKERKVNESH